MTIELSLIIHTKYYDCYQLYLRHNQKIELEFFVKVLLLGDIRVFQQIFENIHGHGQEGFEASLRTELA